MLQGNGGLVSKAKKIAVLTQNKDDFESRHYFLAMLIECWQEAGIEIVLLHGTKEFVPADILILHVDMTVTPEEYLSLASRYPVVINGRVTDISKQKVSTHIIGQKDPHDGPVIIKSNLNAGGIPERILERTRERGNPWRRLKGTIMRKLPWSLTGALNPHDYPIFPDSGSVPLLAWRNPRLVVEKFLPEREGDFYCVRHWLFFGDQEFNYRVFSHHPIVKAGNTVHREWGIPIPDDLRAIRTKLGFDYGKFDYVVVDGETMLFDANRTPTIIPDNPGKGKVLAEELADGLHAFL
jgi:hypothetical protein